MGPIPLQAVGTYSDTRTRDVAADAATAWRATPAEVAQVDAQGRLTGLREGQATVTATQSVAPTWGNPQPDPVVGQARVTVGPAAPLALATGRATLTVGETATVSITTPYPAGASPYPIQLDATGTGSLQLPSGLAVGPGLTSVTAQVRATAAGTIMGGLQVQPDTRMVQLCFHQLRGFEPQTACVPQRPGFILG